MNIIIDGNSFSKSGISLSIHTQGLNIDAKLDFGPLTPLKYDIMGPFALGPFMECRHSVISMKHSVFGTVYLNGQRYDFYDDAGYWEGDRGRSFPEEYVWTQCSFSGGSLMLSAADIPLAGFHFTGIIGYVLWKGHEYRLATYLGAKALQLQDGSIRIVQGDLELEAKFHDSPGRPLKAPAEGSMIRTIHENPCCRVFYRFSRKGHTLFAFESHQASFEYEYGR